jgi:REP element-mobilizing transposase RayT
MRRRKNSLRLSGYDYSQSGAYFVTILTHKRLHLLGSIDKGIMTLSAVGKLAKRCWYEIPDHFPSVELDAFVVMPNHLHGIIILHNDGNNQPALGHIIGTYKGAVTRIARRSTLDIDLDHPVWHRNFHDHIIRSQESYRYIATYVANNPACWFEDSLNN